MRKILTVVSVACLAVGCGNKLSEEDTRVAWTSTYVALQQGSAQAQAVATGSPVAPSAEVDGITPRVAAQVDYNWACLEGGTAHFVGSAEVDATSGSSDVSFDLASDFDGCTVAGVSMSGSLDYSAAVSASDTGAVSTTLSMNGSISYEGKIEGSCDFDMKMSVSVGSLDGVGEVSAQFDGTICGHSAKATLNVQG